MNKIEKLLPYGIEEDSNDKRIKANKEEILLPIIFNTGGQDNAKKENISNNRDRATV